jgi:hypothetical protein
MRKVSLLLIILIVTALLVAVGCKNEEENLPPFPDEPTGKVIESATSLTLVTLAPYTPGQNIVIKLTPTAGSVYAVYRKVFYQPANGDWLNAPLTSDLSNAFPQKTDSFTAITSKYPDVQGTVTIPADAKGQITLGVATYKLEKGVWSSEETWYTKTVVVTVVGESCTANGAYQCSPDGMKIEKCSDLLWITNNTCALGCYKKTAVSPYQYYCKECAAGAKWCSGNKVMTCSAYFKNATSVDCGATGAICKQDGTTAACGVCKEADAVCKTDTVTKQTCTNGIWVNETCPFVCSGGVCASAPTR